FQPLTIVAGITGTREYRYTDATAITGRNFYRLQYTEPGARALYSRTVAVNSRAGKELLVFPNPVSNRVIYLELSTPHTGELRIILTNASGRTVYSQKLQTNNSSQFRIDRTAGVPAGSYLLQIIGNGIQQAQHIICF
ncbi:MAG: T9SS type A sorting domain-containing protein, partial [Chitinophagaceae bacterium]